MSTVVLVHGASHGAWCWYRLVPVLEARGHDVVTPDLPAHGIDQTPATDVTLDDYATRVEQVISEQSEPVVLVGHSMSGMVVTAVTERAPEAIESVVYLTAYLPGPGETVVDQRVEGSLVAENFAADEARGVGTYAHDVRDELFYGDCSREDRALAGSLLRPEPLAPLSDPVGRTDERFGSVHRGYIRCTADRAITIEKQDEMVEDHGADAVATLEASHSPFFSMPEATADAIETVAFESTGVE